MKVQHCWKADTGLKNEYAHHVIIAFCSGMVRKFFTNRYELMFAETDND